MFIVNGYNRHGISTSAHPTVEEALAKASEFSAAGMTRVGIFDTDGTQYTEKELDLLVAIEIAERRAGGDQPTP